MPYLSSSPAESVLDAKMDQDSDSSSSSDSEGENETDPTLEHRITESFSHSYFDMSNPLFVPEGALDELVTEATIRKILGIESAEGEKDLVNFIKTRAKKLFAISVYSGVYSSIEEKRILKSMKRFFKAAFTDQELPVEQPALNVKNHCLYSVDKFWDYHKTFRFAHEQWKFLAPVFKVATEDHHNHDFQCLHILPFIKKCEEGSASGAFGQVSKYELHPSHRDGFQDQYVAIKHMQPRSEKDRTKMVNDWGKEASILQKMNSLEQPHIVRFITAFRRGDRGKEDHYLMFEWAEGGNLRNLWKTLERPALTPALVKSTIKQVLGLANALHKAHDPESGPHFRHGDLKPENILWFTENPKKDMGTLKIGDWGLAKQHNMVTELRSNKTTTNFGTRRYEPPEVETGIEVGLGPNPGGKHSDKKRSRLYDIWAMGCITLEFIVWLLYGPKGLANFNRDVRSGASDSCSFYQTTIRSGKPIARVHNSVVKWMDHMAKDPACQVGMTALGDLLDLVRAKLLVVKLPARGATTDLSTIGSPSTSRRSSVSTVDSNTTASTSDVPTITVSNADLDGVHAPMPSNNVPGIVISAPDQSLQGAKTTPGPKPLSSGPERARAKEFVMRMEEIATDQEESYWYTHVPQRFFPDGSPSDPQPIPPHILVQRPLNENAIDRGTPDSNGRDQPTNSRLIVTGKTGLAPPKTVVVDYGNTKLEEEWKMRIDNDFAMRILGSHTTPIVSRNQLTYLSYRQKSSNIQSTPGDASLAVGSTPLTQITKPQATKDSSTPTINSSGPPPGHLMSLANNSTSSLNSLTPSEDSAVHLLDDPTPSSAALISSLRDNPSIPLVPSHPAKTGLCSICLAFRQSIWTPGFSKTYELSELEKRAKDQSCDLCGLLWRACERYGAVMPMLTTALFERVGSNIKLNGVPRPALSIFVSPDLRNKVDHDIQIGFGELPSTDSETYFEIIKQWLADCDENHRATCRPLLHHESSWNNGTATLLAAGKRLPTRVLDVGFQHDPQVRLLHTKKGDSGEWLALSHQWGPSPHFCTTTDNLPAHLSGIKVGDLPATFQDAVTVARKLGFRYLWIDSLCIVQGPGGDFNQQAKQMEMVYSGASCVLAISRGVGHSAGFLNPRKKRDYVSLHHHEHGRDDSRGSGSLPPFFISENIDDFEAHVLEGNLNKRGWVFQEHALARRTIFFTEHQMYFECGNGVRCETMMGMKSDLAGLLGDPSFPRILEEAKQGERIQRYQELYSRYSRLGLTNDFDRPLAIDGLQSRILSTLNIKGGFGVFDEGGKKGMLRRSLLWIRGEETDSLKRIIFPKDRATSVVPSWSWMAYTGGIDYLSDPDEFGGIEWEAVQSPWWSAPTTAGLSPSTPNGYSHGITHGPGQFRRSNSEVQGGNISLIAKATQYDLSGLGKEDLGEANLVWDMPGQSEQPETRCVVLGRVKNNQIPRDQQRHYLLLVKATLTGYQRGYKIFERVGAGYLPGKCIAQGGVMVSIH